MIWWKKLLLALCGITARERSDGTIVFNNGKTMWVDRKEALRKNAEVIKRITAPFHRR